MSEREREVHYPQRAEWAAQAAGGCQWACELVREIGPLSSGAVARWHGACGGTALALAYATRRVSHHVRDAACRSRARFDCRSSAQRSPVLCAWSVRVEFSGTCDVRRLSCLYSSFSKANPPTDGKTSTEHPIKQLHVARDLEVRAPSILEVGFSGAARVQVEVAGKLVQFSRPASSLHDHLQLP